MAVKRELIECKREKSSVMALCVRMGAYFAHCPDTDGPCEDTRIGPLVQVIHVPTGLRIGGYKGKLARAVVDLLESWIEVDWSLTDKEQILRSTTKEQRAQLAAFDTARKEKPILSDLDRILADKRWAGATVTESEEGGGGADLSSRCEDPACTREHEKCVTRIEKQGEATRWGHKKIISYELHLFHLLPVPCWIIRKGATQIRLINREKLALIRERGEEERKGQKMADLIDQEERERKGAECVAAIQADREEHTPGSDIAAFMASISRLSAEISCFLAAA